MIIDVGKYAMIDVVGSTDKMFIPNIGNTSYIALVETTKFPKKWMLNHLPSTREATVTS
jgi:hypothetical protein